MTVPPKPKPGFVPDGHVSLFDALCVLGEAMFGDEWTGKEIHARTPAQRSEDVRRSMRAKRRTVFRPNRDGGAKNPPPRGLTEAEIAEIGSRLAARASAENILRERRDAASQSLRQMASAEKIKPVILTKSGEFIPIRPSTFRGDDAPKVVDTGRARARVGGVYVEEWVLFPREELMAAIRGAYPSSLEGEPPVSLADRRPPADQLPAKAETVEMPERAQPERGPSAVRPNRRGRKKGSGGYDSKDAPLLEEIHALVENEEPMGLWHAALTVADRAPGGGTPESKAKRLAKKYKAKYGLR